MNMCDYSAVVEDVLLNATDYIGNRPEVFGADNKALETMRVNKKFRDYVAHEVDGCVDEYKDLSQEEAADVVWELYQAWAYSY